MFSNVRSSQTIEIIADKYNSYEIARQDFLLTLCTGNATFALRCLYQEL